MAAKQEHMRQLEAEMASLQHSTLIVSAGGQPGLLRAPAVDVWLDGRPAGAGTAASARICKGGVGC